MAEKLCKNFAKATHDAWGVGHKDTQSGILIAASQHERCVYISTGRGIAALLTDAHTGVIVERMKPWLRTGRQGLARHQWDLLAADTHNYNHTAAAAAAAAAAEAGEEGYGYELPSSGYGGAMYQAVEDIRAVLLAHYFPTAAAAAADSDSGSGASASGRPLDRISAVVAAQQAQRSWLAWFGWHAWLGWRAALRSAINLFIEDPYFMVFVVWVCVTCVMNWMALRQQAAAQETWQQCRRRLLLLEEARARVLAPAPVSAPAAATEQQPQQQPQPAAAEADPAAQPEPEAESQRRAADEKRAGHCPSDSKGSDSEEKDENKGKEKDEDKGKEKDEDKGKQKDEDKGKQKGGEPQSQLRRRRRGGGGGSGVGSGLTQPLQQPQPPPEVPLAAHVPLCPICLDDLPLPEASAAAASAAAAAVAAALATATGSTAAAITLPCAHRFHDKCISEWMGTQGKQSCPLCRKPAYGPPPAAHKGRGNNGRIRNNECYHSYNHDVDLRYLLEGMHQRYPAFVRDPPPAPAPAAAAPGAWGGAGAPQRMTLTQPLATDSRFLATEPRVVALARQAARQQSSSSSSSSGGGGSFLGGFGGGSSYGGSGGTW